MVLALFDTIQVSKIRFSHFLYTYRVWIFDSISVVDMVLSFFDTIQISSIGIFTLF